MCVLDFQADPLTVSLDGLARRRYLEDALTLLLQQQQDSAPAREGESAVEFIASYFQGGEERLAANLHL